MSDSRLRGGLLVVVVAQHGTLQDAVYDTAMWLNVSFFKKLPGYTFWYLLRVPVDATLILFPRKYMTGVNKIGQKEIEKSANL